MRNVVSIMVLCPFLILTEAQAQKSFDFVLGGGLYFTPINAPTLHRTGSFAAEIAYHHTPRISVAAGFITARYLYGREGEWVIYNNIRRRVGSETQSNIMFKYNLLPISKSRLSIGGGVGVLFYGNEILLENTNLGTTPVHISNTDFGFPLCIEYDRILSRKVLLGAKVGTFVFPDYPLVGHSVGLLVKYKIQ